MKYHTLTASILLVLSYSLWADINQKKKNSKTSLLTTDPRHIKSTEENQKKQLIKNSNKSNKSSQNQEYVLHIEITLGNSRIVKGDLPVKAPTKFKIRHIKEDIRYEKEIQLADIELIEIRRWKGQLLTQKKNGNLYEFQPDRIYVRLKDGYNMLAIGNVFSFIRQFPVYNSNGRVYMFAFWRDLLQKDGTWHTGLEGPTHSRRTCHKDTVRKIKIISIKKGGKSNKQSKS